MASASTVPARQGWSAIGIWEYTAKGTQLLHRHEVNVAFVKDLAFSPDKRYLAGGGEKGRLFLWDAQTGKELANLDLKCNQVTQVAFSRDGRTLAVGTNAPFRVDLWDIGKRETLREIATTQARDIRGLSFSADGSHVRFVQVGGAVCVYNVPSGSAVKSLRIPNIEIRAAHFFEGEKHLLAAIRSAGKRTFALLDLGSGAVLAQSPLEADVVDHISVSRDGRHAVTGGGETWLPELKRFESNGDYDLRLWQLPESVWPSSTNFDAKVSDHEDAVLALDYPTPSDTARYYYGGQVVVSIGRDRKLNLWNAAALAKGESKITSTRIDEAQGTISCASVSKDGRLAAVGWPELSIVEVWWAVRDEGGSSHRVATIRDRNLKDVEQVLLSPDGMSAYTISPTAGVLWNAAAALVMHSDTGISAAAFGADSRTIAIAGKALEIHRFDTRPENVKRQQSLPLPGDSRVCRLALSANAKRLAVGQEDGTITVLDVQTGKTVCRFSHSGTAARTVTDLEFHGTDRVLVAAVGGSRVVFWDLETKQLTFEALAPPGAARNVCVSPDGRLLFSAGEQTGDDAIYLWRLPESVWPATVLTPE
jgi:WD40 repeat protein